MIAARNEPAPLSDVLSTTKVESSRRGSSGSHSREFAVVCDDDLHPRCGGEIES